MGYRSQTERKERLQPPAVTKSIGLLDYLPGGSYWNPTPSTHPVLPTSASISNTRPQPKEAYHAQRSSSAVLGLSETSCALATPKQKQRTSVLLDDIPEVRGGGEFVIDWRDL